MKNRKPAKVRSRSSAPVEKGRKRVKVLSFRLSRKGGLQPKTRWGWAE